MAKTTAQYQTTLLLKKMSGLFTMKGCIMQGIAILGTAIAAVAALPYIQAVIKGTVRPKVVSWAVWAVLAAIMTISAVVEGQLPSAALSFVGFASCTIITILGWRQGVGRLTRTDYICLAGAAIGIASLAVLKDPLLAIVVAVAVDAVAFIPTLIHAWVSPQEESLAAFALASFGGVFALIAALSGTVAAAGVLYPAYSAACNAVAAALIVAGRLATMRPYAYSSEDA